jgi:hypothetical protein
MEPRDVQPVGRHVGAPTSYRRCQQAAVYKLPVSARPADIAHTCRPARHCRRRPRGPRALLGGQSRNEGSETDVPCRSVPFRWIDLWFADPGVTHTPLQRGSLFDWLISHQPVVLFSQQINHQQPVFSQNKPALAINHQY